MGDPMTYDEIMADHAAAPADGQLRVIGWTSCDDVNERGLKEVGWNGFAMGDRRRPEDAEETESDEDFYETAYFEPFRAAAKARGLRRGGDWHQQAASGVAVFSDYGYMDFYMDRDVPEPHPPIR